MRAKILLLSVALLSTGCASLRSGPGYTKPGMVLGDLPPTTDARSVAQGQDDGRPRVPSFPLQNRAVGDEQSATLTRQAVVGAIDEVRDSTGSIASALSRLAARTKGIGGANGIFSRHVVYGANQLPWIQGALASSTVLADAAVEVTDADMELAILRMTGPRLQAAMSGATLLGAWVDFLSLADAVLRQCPSYSAETLFVDMERVQRLMEPSMAALSSEDLEQVEATATAMPELMGRLTQEFASIREGARVAAVRSGQVMMAAQLVEMVTMASALKMSLPRLLPPPGAPVALGTTLVMGSNGVMAGSQIIVSAEWVEMIRRLVQAGVLSLPAVSAAVRIHAGQVMMAQADGELSEGVRDALGDGPEVRGMHETGKAGAGMSEAPSHHVLPNEHRAWFEQRGFTGDMDIDNFCVKLEQAHHQAIHGGGNWRMGRLWPDEWSRLIMRTLQEVEARAGRMLTRNEILNTVAKRMKDYKIPMRFVSGRGR